MMTKKEAKKQLYVFLKKHGLSEKYYYNCITCNSSRDSKKYLNLSGRELLRKIIDDHCDLFFSLETNHKYDGFFNFSDHSFNWHLTPEGGGYWYYWYKKWRDYTGEQINEYIEKRYDKNMCDF